MKQQDDSPARKKIHQVQFVMHGDAEQIQQMISKIKNTYDANDLVSSLAIEIWRLEKRIEKVQDIILKETDANASSVLDQLQRIKDIFKRQEIEVHDHVGENYNDGMSLRNLHTDIVDYVPSGEMRIIETVKPSVYFKGQIISHGEVIVAKGK